MVEKLQNLKGDDARRRAQEAMARMREQQAEQARQRAEQQRQAELQEQQQQQQQAVEPGSKELTKDAFLADPAIAEELGLQQDQLAKAFEDAAKLDGNETMSDKEMEDMFLTFSAENKPLPAPSVVNPEAPAEKPALDPTSQTIQDVADQVGDRFLAEQKQKGELVDAAANWVGEQIVEGGKVQGAQQNQLIDQAGQQANSLIQDAGNLLGGMLDQVGLTGAGQSVRDAATDTGQAVEQVADTVGDVQQWKTETEATIAGKGIDMVGDVYKGVNQTAGELVDVGLDVGATALTEGGLAAAEKAADKAIGPEIPAYKDQIDGYTGVLTNRLDRGESIMVKGEGNVELGLVGAFAGMKTTGATTLGRDADGNITLKVEVAQEIEGGGKAEFGVDGQIGNVKVGAAGEAKIGGVVQAGAAVTLKFNPNNPADVQRLQALLEPKGDATTLATNPAAMTLDPKALQEAVKSNFDSAEITTAAGIRGGASVTAEAGTLAAQVGVNAELLAGSKIKYNRDGSKETTLFVRGEGSVGGGVTESTTNVTAGGKATGEYIKSFSVSQDKDGKVTNFTESTSMQGSATYGVTQNLGPGANRERLKPADRTGNKTLGDTYSGDGAGGTGENQAGTTWSESRKLNDEGSKKLMAMIEKGAVPIAAYNELMKDPANVVTEKQTTTSNQYSYGLGVNVSIGAAKISLGTKVTVGKSKDTVEKVDGSNPDNKTGIGISPTHRDNVADIY